MIIKSVKNLKFKDSKGVYSIEGAPFALYEEGKGFISLDGGKSIYCPVGGRKALKSILDAGGFLSEVDYIKPLALTI